MHERNGRQRLRGVCVYFPTHAGVVGNWLVLVRLRDSAGGALRARDRLQAVLDQIAPNLADFLNPMDDVYALQIYPFRVTSWVAGFLAGVALLLTLGHLGVMAYLITQRTKEIGIRVALGATAWTVVRMVLSQSPPRGNRRRDWRRSHVGHRSGFRLRMEVIQPYDWAPYAATVVLVFLAAIAASYAPARHAVSIDPVRTLRCD